MFCVEETKRQGHSSTSPCLDGQDTDLIVNGEWFKDHAVALQHHVNLQT